MIRSAIVDGDIVAYQAAEACQRAVEWEHDLWSVWADVSEGVRVATALIEQIATDLKATKLILAFTDPYNFRKDVMPEYKASRAKKPKPIGLKAVKEKLGQKFETYTKPGLEGDDVLGILATHPRLLPGERIVVSLDKDLMQIPGKHYNMRTKEFSEVTETQGNFFFMQQCLSGDPTDGYPGCPGIGPVKAKAALDKVLHEGTPWASNERLMAVYWKTVVGMYLKAGLTEEDALRNARVARICQHKDYDFKANKVKLWTPA